MSVYFENHIGIVPFGFYKSHTDWTCSNCNNIFSSSIMWWYTDATVFIDNNYSRKKCYECFRNHIDRDVSWWEQCFVCSQSIYTYDYMFTETEYFICEECDSANPFYDMYSRFEEYGLFIPGYQHVYR